MNENENGYETKQLNDWFKRIDQTKSLEEQIEILKEREYLSDYWHVKYYHDNKELNHEIFKVKAAYALNDIGDNSFETIFGCTFAMLADKLIQHAKKKTRCLLMISKKQR